MKVTASAHLRDFSSVNHFHVRQAIFTVSSSSLSWSYQPPCRGQWRIRPVRTSKQSKAIWSAHGAGVTWWRSWQ